MTHISQTKHNHIATPMEGMNRTTVDVGAKQKRQIGWSTINGRKKRNRSFSYYDNEEMSNESEHKEDSNEYNDNYSRNRVRLEDTNDQRNPFWDTYDTLNQYYLEIGKRKIVMPIFL